MYKRTGNLTHYLPRKGSYSTHPHRNGRVDVLPPSAKTPFYDIATQISTANAMVESLRQQKVAAEKKLHEFSRVDQLRAHVGSRGSEANKIRQLQDECARLDDEMRKVRRRTNELKAILAGGRDLRFEVVFLRLARAELPDDLYARLENQANDIIRRARE
jgi:hypothetical protein